MLDFNVDISQNIARGKSCACNQKLQPYSERAQPNFGRLTHMHVRCQSVLPYKWRCSALAY